MQNERRILIVDDEPSVAQALCYVLDHPGRQFATASNGREALTKIASEHFDIVITDHKMPLLCGLDLVRRLREQNFAGKIVVLSAHLSPDNVEAYAALAVDEMLPKPFDLSRLRRTINNLTSLEDG
ncbi:MAG: hypothetical protein DMF03_12630 [Verrucomicrobia bacterium]|nr:MAG: hypothetical protein DMF03_12630 [Verrucomicrobiota bacterium]